MPISAATLLVSTSGDALVLHFSQLLQGRPAMVLRLHAASLLLRLLLLVVVAFVR